MSSVFYLYFYEWILVYNKNILIRYYGYKCDGSKNKILILNCNDNFVNICDFLKLVFI